jgi:hypothetical protein
MPNHPKRHHYLPESYLARFTEEKALWVYDIKNDQLRPQIPKDTGVQGYFNAIEDHLGNRSFEIEEALSNVEGDFSVAMKKVASREPLANRDREIIAYFTALQKLRGPDFEEDVGKMNDAMMRRASEFMFSDQERVGEILKQQQDEDGQAPNVTVTAAALHEFILSGEYSIKTHRNQSLKLMLELAPNLAKNLHGLDWLIMFTKVDSPFVTTDRPFSIVPPPNQNSLPWRGVGILTTGAKKIIPLSAKSCLLMGDQGRLCAYTDCNADAVRTINLNICHGANRFVIGAERGLVQSLVTETQNAHEQRGTEWGGSRLTLQ